MKKLLIPILRIAVSTGLLIIVIYAAGLFEAQGRKALLDTLRQTNLGYLLIAFLIGFFIHVTSSIKWYMLLYTHKMKVGFTRVLAYYMVGQFYNQILPTSVGGDAVRAFELGRYTNQQADSFASVFVERYTGIVVLVLFSFFAIILNLQIFNHPFITIGLSVFTLVLSALGWMAFDARPVRFIESLVASRAPILSSPIEKIKKVQSAINIYRQDKNALTWAFINSFIFYFLAVVNVYLTARVFTDQVDFLAIAIATPVIMLIMNIPISIGNLGLLEFAYTFTFTALGFSPAVAVSTALLIRLKSIVDGAIGGLFHPFFVTRGITQVHPPAEK